MDQSVRLFRTQKDNWLDVDIVTYLKDERLRWGQPDTMSRLGTSHTDPVFWQNGDGTPPRTLEYFTAQTPAKYLSIVSNDWPYSSE